MLNRRDSIGLGRIQYPKKLQYTLPTIFNQNGGTRNREQ